MKKTLFTFFLLQSVFAVAQNVGIGTTTPQRNLHIVDSTLHPNLTIESPAITLDKDVTIELKQANGASDWLRLKKYSFVSGESINGISLAGASTLFSGLDGGDLKIGSLRSTSALDIFAGGQRRMLIQPNGNVGIGNVVAQSLLHIKSPTAEVVRIEGPSGYMSFYDNSNYTGYLQSSGSTLSVASAGTNKLSLVTNFLERLTALPNGNVGINNNNPLVNFHISSPVSEVARIQGPTGFMSFYDDANYRGYIQASANGLDIGAYGASHSLSLVTNFAERFRITPNGNIGIGIIPDSRLEVYGTYNSFPLVKLTQLGTNAPALKISASSGANGGLELENAAIKVSGTNKAAFQVTSTFVGGSAVTIPTTSFANSPTDILFVTHNRTLGQPIASSLGVFWVPPQLGNPGEWRIYTENGSVIPVGEIFNVLVIKQ